MTSTMQLEFSQAMSDFKVMFPEMDKEVIEAVLRANHGAVDATIDQLLVMSVDNQNESLRSEMEQSTLISAPGWDITIEKKSELVRKPIGRIACEQQDMLSKIDEMNIENLSPVTHTTANRRWNPMLLPLPPEFLRLASGETIRFDFDLPDEHLVKMLQNKEFMKQLRWNQEFMKVLGTEQELKGRNEDDAAFKERLKHMGQVSRRKFLQMSRVFAWQKNKTSILRSNSEAQPLKEEPSDEEGEIDCKK